MPTSWTSRENIRVPTIAAALLRKRVEKSRPMQAIAMIGIR